MRQEWPLVGRDSELDFAHRVMRTPTLSGLVLVGRAGVGKTRLAKEVLARAAADDASVHWARATKSAAGIPLGALAHLLPRWDSRVGQVGLLRAAAQSLVDSAQGKRLVLGVDDAADLDATSATLLYHLCHTRSAFVVVTVESGTRVADPILALWKDGFAERLDIAELTRQQTDELMSLALEGDVDGSALQGVWELTLGNALFLHEIVEGSRESGALVRVHGIWQFDRPPAPSRRLLDLIETRVGALSEDEHTLLTLLAYGEPLGSDVLLKMGAQRVLTTAERKGLIVSERSGRRLDVRLVHPLYAEVVRRRTSPLGERQAYQILTRAIEQTGARRATDHLRSVSWRLAGGLPTDRDMLWRAAVQAGRIGDPHAEPLARAAAEQDGGFAAGYLHGQVLMESGRAAEAEHTLAALTEQASDDHQRASLAASRIYNLYWALGDGDRAHAVLRSATDTVATVTARDELTVVRAAIMLNRGDCEEVIGRLDDVLHRPNQPDRVTGKALATASFALGQAGRYDHALAAAERGIELMRRTEDPTAPRDVETLEASRCAAHTLAGHLDTAQALADEGYTRALSHHWPAVKALHAYWLGIVALSRGLVRTARCWLHEASAAGRVGPFPFMLELLSALTIATALAGDVPVAESLLAEMDVVIGALALPCLPWATRARLWVAAAGGETSRAVQLALRTADLARDWGHRHCELVALHDVVRLDKAALVVDRLTATAEVVQTDLAPLYTEHAQALAAADGDRLDMVADRFAAMGTRLLAAEAAAQGSRAHDAAGRTGRSKASANRAHTWVQACEGARTPALVRLRAPGELTGRELEIAQLAASKMTSKAIAERLGVSVRTVDNLLHSVYTKLGVTGRLELAREIGLVPAVMK